MLAIALISPEISDFLGNRKVLTSCQHNKPQVPITTKVTLEVVERNPACSVVATASECSINAKPMPLDCQSFQKLQSIATGEQSRGIGCVSPENSRSGGGSASGTRFHSHTAVDAACIGAARFSLLACPKRSASFKSVDLPTPYALT